MTNIAHELNVGPVAIVDSDTGISLNVNDDGSVTEVNSESSDQLLYELVFILQSILEKMPRVTGNDQAAVSVEVGSLSTVSTVTTCGTLTTVSQIGTRAAMTAADAMIMQGTSHIYNNLVVS